VSRSDKLRNLWRLNSGTDSSPKFPLILLFAGLSGLVIAILVAIFADRGNDPAARIARTSMGFFVAIVWIMAIADEVVQVLQVSY
jgi:hypothetical protein